MIRKYQLTSEWETDYTLIFDDNGKMFVNEYKDFEQPYKNPRSMDIPPENFGNFTVNGKTLKELVVKKLEQILPPSN
ncbi:MAG TPA: hypothetical protein VMA13_02530 [Candidatus Saccharimonadales bacterium]|nr:hypothetical protein [Candidatus Saccharimonadales bacterium]